MASKVKNLIYVFLYLTTLSVLSKQTEPEEIKKTSIFFDNNINHNILYIYAPGMMATENMMGRYCPEFTAQTGEKIMWNNGGHVIGQPHSAVVFPEINLRRSKSFSLNPITNYINKLKKNLFPIFKRYFQEVFNFNFFNFKHIDNPKSKHTVVNYRFNFSKANIAQKQDIKTLNKTYLKHLKKNKDIQIILYGDSRGAATIFNFIAQHKPKQVKAAVLDGIFDSVPHCIKHFMFADKDPEAENCIHDIVSFVMGSYKKKGPFPIDYADKINDDIPLLLVTSIKDGLTAAQGAFNLYAKLKNKDFKKVHLLVLENSLHPCYMIDDKNDKEKYESVVHAFYKHYNLPCNSLKAQQGLEAFKLTQPSIEELSNKYKNLSKCSSCNWQINMKENNESICKRS